MNIHSTAIVVPGASLGENVTVGPFAYFAGNVQIGSTRIEGLKIEVRDDEGARKQ